MSLCVYHETTGAVAVCSGCKQGICSSCLQYGRDGMCGMCVEVADAQQVIAEAERAEQAASPQKAVAMCRDHPGQPARAQCEHCAKRCCAYCLDLYEHCVACRQLPACARHEALIGDRRCTDCGLNFCKICLAGTDRCDSCRLQRAAKATQGGRANTAKLAQAAPRGSGTLPARSGGTNPLGPTPTPARTPTGSLSAPPPVRPPSEATPSSNRMTADPKLRAAAAASRAKANQAKGPSRLPWIAGGVIGLGLIWRIFLSGPHLNEVETVAALKNEMGLVQHAAVILEVHTGSYPSSVEAIVTELKREGFDPAAMPLPFKLVVNADATVPLSISYKRLDEGFEVRALDRDGRPLADDGRDVVLRPPQVDEDAKPRATPTPRARDDDEDRANEKT